MAEHHIAGCACCNVGGDCWPCVGDPPATLSMSLTDVVPCPCSDDAGVTSGYTLINVDSDFPTLLTQSDYNPCAYFAHMDHLCDIQWYDVCGGTPILDPDVTGATFGFGLSGTFCDFLGYLDTVGAASVFGGTFFGDAATGTWTCGSGVTFSNGQDCAVGIPDVSFHGGTATVG